MVCDGGGHDGYQFLWPPGQHWELLPGGPKTDKQEAEKKAEQALPCRLRMLKDNYGRVEEK